MGRAIPEMEKSVIAKDYHSRVEIPSSTNSMNNSQVRIIQRWDGQKALHKRDIP
jgi:hypothetical protein